MAKYLLLMYGKEMKMPAKVTKEQMEAGIKPWTDYLGPLIKKKAILASGPTQWNGKTVTAEGAEEFKPEKVDLVGCMVIKAKDMNEAVKIAKTSPHAKSKAGATVIKEIIEVM